MREHDAPPPAGHSTNTKTPGIWNSPPILAILSTETAERVAYFGFRAILVLYFTQGLQLEESTSVALYSATVALAYFSPLLGAVLADSGWGRYKTIWRFGGMYIVGLMLLTWGAYRVQHQSSVGQDDTQPSDVAFPLFFEQLLTFVGLFLVCMGTGGIKPCVSAFGADQVVLQFAEQSTSCQSNNPSGSTNEEELVREFFNSFYVCINIGALSSFAVIPLIRAHFGFGAAFLIPTVAMTVALVVFGSQSRRYKHRKNVSTGVGHDQNSAPPSLGNVLKVAMSICLEKLVDCSWWSGSPTMSGRRLPVPTTDDDRLDNEATTEREHTDQEWAVHQEASQALHLLPLMAFFPIFWMLYDQQGSVWTLQATRLNLYGIFEPEQLNILNPLEIMILVPLFDKCIYPLLESRGWDLQPTKRMIVGMGLTAVAFAMSAWLEVEIQRQQPGSVSVFWQAPQITVLTVAEILLNVTGLEFAYSQAPENMQALILALFLFMTAIGDGLGALLYASVFGAWTVTTTMSVCAILMLINTGCFTLVARRWRPFEKVPAPSAEGTNNNIELV